MKILVTGATGFTGHNLAKRLLDDGHEVRILVRSKKRVALASHPLLDIREGDIRDRDAVRDSVNGVEKVFNIAAMFRSAKSVDQDYHDIHVKGVKHLLEAALEYNVARVVHCSTVGVHGDVKNPPATEESPFAPADIYQRTKLEGELWAREFAAKNGIALSVVRPTAIYGPGDLRLLKLFKLAARNVTPVLGDGKMFYHMVYIDDLVQGFILASEREEAIGEVFIIGGAENMCLDDLLNTIAQILNKPRKILHIPALPFQLAGSLCEKICIPLGIEPPIYRRRVDFFTKSRSFDIAKAKAKLGYQPKFGLKEGLELTATWYRQQNLL
ncbi:NAD-dependent epimerase/dehydratase family protein [Desulforhopalus singaporensis]|uniref:Nucleoside-diphosphate-sugar epimerase n=1 Tax=Desulforhopalus singaporensis TaxID=91360 RepID=A0A1H0QWG4_9BACT|nr:NAD-dependent epimerase/dehydratase family protein [Desulforhopalus singaporensis]SDP21597.1 Nucleoside-diphosphate-sugar epimerase [Desulforhopalus singaporensis]